MAEKTQKENKREKVGVVVSNKMQKTVVVAVENLVKHGMYQKYIKRTNKFLAHNENPAINVGDRVETVRGDLGPKAEVDGLVLHLAFV